FKGDRQQRISRQHGDTVAKNFVASWPATPEIVVIHARQIVMHERVGVDAFECTSEWKRVIDLSAASFGGGKTKNWPKAFSAGEQAVAHGLVNGSRFCVLFWQMAIQCPIDLFLPRLEIRFQVHSA